MQGRQSYLLFLQVFQNVSWECFINSSSLWVSVSPGRILFTVILYCPISLASVLAQEATASRIVLDTPRLGRGVFTEVEMILMILPYPASRIPGTTALIRFWLLTRCCLKACSNTSAEASR